MDQINKLALELGTTPERIKEELFFAQKDKELGNRLESLYYDDGNDYYDSTEEFLLEPFDSIKFSK